MSRYHDRDYEYIETDGPYSHDGGMYRGGHVSFPEFVAWKHAQEHDDGTVTAPIVYDARISDGDGNIMKYFDVKLPYDEAFEMVLYSIGATELLP